MLVINIYFCHYFVINFGFIVEVSSMSLNKLQRMLLKKKVKKGKGFSSKEAASSQVPSLKEVFLSRLP